MIIARFEEFRRDVVFLAPPGKHPGIYAYAVTEEYAEEFEVIDIVITAEGVVIINFDLL